MGQHLQRLRLQRFSPAIPLTLGFILPASALLCPPIPSPELGSVGPRSEWSSEFARCGLRFATGARVDVETPSPDKVAGAVHHLDRAEMAAAVG